MSLICIFKYVVSLEEIELVKSSYPARSYLFDFNRLHRHLIGKSHLAHLKNINDKLVNIDL